jgi:hypothetical protein
VRALARTEHGVYAVDVEEEEVLGLVDEIVPESTFRSFNFRVLAGDAHGSTAFVVVDRRPPLMVSYDAGRTWGDAGGGLPPGRAVSISRENPDLVLYAARNRLYLSEDGGRFWRVLAPELPEIEAVAWAEEPT